MYKKLQVLSVLSAIALLQAACSGTPADSGDAEVKSIPLVTVGTPVTHSFSNSIVFNAVTQYQQNQ